MIKTVFVPLMVKSYPVGESSQSARKKLTANMTAALAELDTELDDGWRIISQQYLETDGEAGTVFFIRDDSECLLITDEGLDALDEPVESQTPITGDDFRGWG